MLLTWLTDHPSRPSRVTNRVNRSLGVHSCDLGQSQKQIIFFPFEKKKNQNILDLRRAFNPLRLKFAEMGHMSMSPKSSDVHLANVSLVTPQAEMV